MFEDYCTPGCWGRERGLSLRFFLLAYILHLYNEEWYVFNYDFLFNIQGDSGGPLLIFSTQTECSRVPMYTQIGITSVGDQECGKAGTPAVYTRVSYFIPWIEKIVWNV